MTSPKPREWPLAPALRLTALALLFVGGAMLTGGWLSFAMWFIALVLMVFATIQLVKRWKFTSRRP